MEEGWRAVVALLLFQTSSSSSGRLHVPDRTTGFQLNDHQSRHFRAQRHRGTSQGCSTTSLISTPGIKPHEGITHRHFNPLPWGGLNLASLSSLGHDNPSHPPKAEVARSALEMCARRAFLTGQARFSDWRREMCGPGDANEQEIFCDLMSAQRAAPSVLQQ